MGQARSNAHIRAQKKGKERDLHTCQVCGSREKTQGHHFIDYVFGGSANSENIITLCDEHHTKVHRGLIDLLKF